jgi:hypothetical protein
VSIELFQKCCRCVKIRRVEGLPTRDRHYASRGSFIHHCSMYFFPHQLDDDMERDLMREPMSNLSRIEDYQNQL